MSLQERPKPHQSPSPSLVRGRFPVLSHAFRLFPASHSRLEFSQKSIVFSSQRSLNTWNWTSTGLFWFLRNVGGVGTTRAVNARPFNRRFAAAKRSEVNRNRHHFLLGSAHIVASSTNFRGRWCWNDPPWLLGRQHPIIRARGSPLWSAARVPHTSSDSIFPF